MSKEIDFIRGHLVNRDYDINYKNGTSLSVNFSDFEKLKFEYSKLKHFKSIHNRSIFLLASEGCEVNLKHYTAVLSAEVEVVAVEPIEYEFFGNATAGAKKTVRANPDIDFTILNENGTGKKGRVTLDDVTQLIKENQDELSEIND